ncbi:MAG: HEAT repeat domain-containing protein [Bryobacterales bacterium]
MRKAGLFLPLILALSVQAADPKLDAALAGVVKYDYDQNRQPLFDVEELVRTLPAAEVELQLAAFLKSDANLAAKDFVCRQLSLIGSEAAVPVLESMLASADTVEMARYALERIPGSAPLDALRNGLDKAPADAKPGIVNTLGVRRDTKAVAALEKLASSSDAVLVGSAAAALGRIASPEAVAALGALRDKGVSAALEASVIAAENLARDGNRAEALKLFETLNASSSLAVTRIGALRGLATLSGEKAAPQLVAAMSDSDTQVQAAAIQFLQTVPGPAITSTMIEQLPKLSAPGRVRLVTALALRGDRSAVPAVRAALNDSAPEVRVAATEALAIAGDSGSVVTLAEIAASSSSDEAQRDAARIALDRMQGEDVDRAIVSAIGPAVEGVKIELVRAAGERGIVEASDVLLSEVRSPQRGVRSAAFRALRETAGEAQVPALLELLLATKSAAERRDSERALSAALSRSPAGRSADVVAAYQAADTAAVRVSLLQVMGQSGTAEVLPLLRTTLSAEDPELVRAAILGLTEWPNDEPLQELLAFAGKVENPTHQILALRGALKLLEHPTDRPHGESVDVLAAVMQLAQQPDEKKAVLAQLPSYPTREALKIAEGAVSEPAVAEEAKMAVRRLQRSVR